MKKYVSLFVLMAFLVIPMTFNSCDSSKPAGGSGGGASAADACIPLLQPGTKPVYDYLQPKCSTCHYKGSSAAPSGYYFADPSYGNALAAFANLAKAGTNKLYDKAYDPSHFGGAGPGLKPTMDPLKTAFDNSENAYIDCVNKQTVGPGGPPGGGTDPTKKTTAKTIPANPTTAINLVWNLGTDMAMGAALPGAQFQITIQAVPTATNVKQYYITSPRAQGATAGAIQIKNIRVYINGVLLALNAGGGTWISLNNLAPTGRMHPLAQGTGVMIVEADTALASNTIAIGFGDIAVSTQYPDFNPTTYTRLSANNANVPALERVFQVKCQSCHSAGNAQGGVNLSTTTLLSLKAGNFVVPYVPAASPIFTDMSLPAGDSQVMPPAGPVSAAEIRWVRDWILDGAPN